ncbi:hypothetical protein [Spiroplasma culicicola]|uniref:Uncharacterized protein n=1 Tax=Spiroplasma culicicola AES-1 TaxID=1276246 RepID=W6AHP7_9MOLU|nr:hypothetical protein [Spiroplasma culicicola]AHI53204.1 hypothetical protein SCULI_v1c08640 [Spiroplasma culicicola AES-1]
MKKLLYVLSSVALTTSVAAPIVIFSLRDDENVPETIIAKEFSYSNDLSKIKNDGKPLIGSHDIEVEGLQSVINDIKKTGADLKSNKYKLTYVETKLDTVTFPSINPHFDINRFNEILNKDNKYIKVINHRFEISQISAGNGNAQEEYSITLLADFEVRNNEDDDPKFFRNVRVTEVPSYRPYTDIEKTLKVHKNTLTVEYTIIIDISHVDNGPYIGIKMPEEGVVYYVSQVLQRFNGNAQNPPNPEDQQIAKELQAKILKYINEVHDIKLATIDTPIVEVWSAIENEKGKYELGRKLENNYELDYDINPYFYLAITSKNEAIGTHYVLIGNSKSAVD